jgi:hypothetical protein
MRTIIISFLAFLFANDSGAQVISFSPELQIPVNKIGLGQSFRTDGERAATCFLPTIAPFQSGGPTAFAIHIDAHQESETSTDSNTTSGSVGGGFGGEGFGGSMSAATSSSYSHDKTKNDQQITVIMDVFSDLGHESIQSLSISNPIGTQAVSQNAATFIEKCGVLVATDLYRALRIHLELQLTFDDLKIKEHVANSFNVSMGGSYDMVTADASFATAFDQDLSYGANHLTTTIKGLYMSEKGTAGIGNLLGSSSGTVDDKNALLSRTVSAAGKFLDDKLMQGDKGAVYFVSFSNTDLYASVHLMSWDQRRAFLAWANGAERDLGRLEKMSAGWFNVNDYNEGNVTEESSATLANWAWYRVCAQRSSSSLSKGWFSKLVDQPLIFPLCASSKDVQATIYHNAHLALKASLDACLTADMAQESSDICTDDAMLLAVAPVISMIQTPVAPNSNQLKSLIEGPGGVALHCYPANCPFSDAVKLLKASGVSSFSTLQQFHEMVERLWRKYDVSPHLTIVDENAQPTSLDKLDRTNKYFLVPSTEIVIREYDVFTRPNKKQIRLIIIEQPDAVGTGKTLANHMMKPFYSPTDPESMLNQIRKSVEEAKEAGGEIFVKGNSVNGEFNVRLDSY